MVLLELGNKISSAIKKLNAAPECDEQTLRAFINELSTALIQSDVNIQTVKRLKDSITKQLAAEKDGDRRRVVQQAIARSLMDILQVEKEPFKPRKDKCNVIMTVGLQGAGKTTTCGKLALHYKRRGYRAALVCADTFRAGAFDQLKQNCAKIRVPFYGNDSETDPAVLAREGVEIFRKEHYNYIIVDTSGRHKQEAALFREVQVVYEAVKPDDVIFVLDSHIGQACKDQAQAFKEAVPVGSIIITKLDGHAKGGGAITAVTTTGAPISYIGQGEHLQDLESFDPASFIRGLLGLGDIPGLFKEIQEHVSESMVSNMRKGKFSFRDLQSQFKMMLSMGGVQGLMSKLPGLAPGMDEEGPMAASFLKKSLVMLDSFTTKELDCADALCP
ncbi:MAG: hypothetical protein KVP17_002216, partial [Porospora cf. gigantea B]|uniref:uncharacterized protein n=2 Tax=Porospora cf. gigantea B TaxID=2853592 RepID=UPI0035717DA2